MSTRFVKNSGSILSPRHRDDRSREAGSEVKCPVEGCGKAFIDKNALARHARVHVAAPVYNCPACERGEVKVFPLPNGHWRWSCTTCNSDFGYNTPKPLLD